MVSDSVEQRTYCSVFLAYHAPILFWESRVIHDIIVTHPFRRRLLWYRGRGTYEHHHTGHPHPGRAGSLGVWLVPKWEWDSIRPIDDQMHMPPYHSEKSTLSLSYLSIYPLAHNISVYPQPITVPLLSGA